MSDFYAHDEYHRFSINEHSTGKRVGEADTIEDARRGAQIIEREAGTQGYRLDIVHVDPPEQTAPSADEMRWNERERQRLDAYPHPA